MFPGPTPPFRVRPATPGDRPHLLACYAANRPDLQNAGLPPEQLHLLIEVQFETQQAHYTSHFPGSQRQVILSPADEPVGMIWTDPREDELRVLDGIILPPHRRQGLGSAVLEALKSDFACITIHVEHRDGSIPFFEKRGFVVIDSLPHTALMKWTSG